MRNCSRNKKPTSVKADVCPLVPARLTIADKTLPCLQRAHSSSVFPTKKKMSVEQGESNEQHKSIAPQNEFGMPTFKWGIKGGNLQWKNWTNIGISLCKSKWILYIQNSWDVLWVLVLLNNHLFSFVSLHFQSSQHSGSSTSLASTKVCSSMDENDGPAEGNI